MSEDLEPKKELHDELVSALRALRGAHERQYVEIRGAALLPQDEVPKNQVKLSLRIFDVPAWLRVLTLLFKEEIRASKREVTWNLHICRQYLLDEDEEKVKFTWIFAVTSDFLSAALEDICRVLDVIATNFVWTPPPTQTSPQRKAVAALGPTPDHKIFDTGIEVVNGEVVKMPLLGKVGRNIPEGGLFESGKGQKGAHIIKAGL